MLEFEITIKKTENKCWNLNDKKIKLIKIFLKHEKLDTSYEWGGGFK
jgi:hypothetical protein